MEEYKKPLHAVVVAGPSMGHLNGSLMLGKTLATVGFSVTVVCFERAYEAHKARINVSHASVHLEIVADDRPPAASLFNVTPAMHQNLLRSLSSHAAPPSFLVAHGFSSWTHDVAHSLGIPFVLYWTSNATSFLNLLSFDGRVPSSVKSKEPLFAGCIPGFESFPVDEMIQILQHCSLTKDPLLERYFEAGQVAKNAHCVLIQSLTDIETEALQILQNVFHIDALPIGPLFHQYESSTLANSTNSVTLPWLDAQAPLSVIFVSFGSNYVFTHAGLVELAHGLEASGKAFLWVIRSDALKQECDLDNVLPCGFKERTASRGLIMPWVPQLSVLGHPAVGGFFSHCGWNSTLESMWMGVPMLTCPMGAEQPINNKLITKNWGAGIELEPTLEGTFCRNKVKLGVLALIDEPAGQQARNKAKELSHVFRKAPVEGGKSHSNLLEFAFKMKDVCLKCTQAR